MEIKAFDGATPINDEQAGEALDLAVAQVHRNLPDFTYNCQNHSSVKGFYSPCGNNQWTCGFWPGEVWLAYERTKDESFRESGDILVQSFLERIRKKIEVDHHDMGFLYTPSCVAAYQLTGNQAAREAALLAAQQLASRFQPVGEFIQAWGTLGAKDNYRYIIDCLLNLPILYWAQNETGNDRYGDIARRHMRTCLAGSIRPSGSTFHTVYMDSRTGAFLYGRTCQGYRDDSSWARGQAWAVYGTALCYRYANRPEYLEAFEHVLAYYLSRLPKDLVPYWDLDFGDGDNEPRDSSSASIVACGLLEMAKLSSPEKAGVLETIARQMMYSVWVNYSVQDPAISNGQVLHGTYSKKSPYNTCTPEGVDECVSWGDYFYMEALTRLTGNWKSYW
jgi:unsaturated chondroitin disaccharide hydrolase